MFRTLLLYITVFSVGTLAFASEPTEGELVARDVELEQLLPAAGRGALANIKEVATRRIFLFYAASLQPISQPPPDVDSIVQAWILPEEAAALAVWPLEMQQALAVQRKSMAASEASLKDAANAAAVVKIIKDRHVTRVSAEPGLDKYMLPYEMLCVQFSHARSDELSKPVAEDVDKPDAEKRPVIADSEEVSVQDATALTEILRIARRSSGVFMDKRADAAKRIGELMIKLSPSVMEATSPGIYYEVALMFWMGWGKETSQDYEMAKRYFGQAFSAHKGKYNVLALSYWTTLVNLNRDDPTEFIKFMQAAQFIQSKATIDDVFPFTSVEMAAKNRRLTLSKAVKESVLSSVRDNLDGFIMIVTDEGTLRRFLGKKESLEKIANELKDSTVGQKATALLGSK